jgi:hypothetical protein
MVRAKINNVPLGGVGSQEGVGQLPGGAAHDRERAFKAQAKDCDV